MDRERQKKVLYTKYLLRMVYNDNNIDNNNNEQQVYTITATFFTGSNFIMFYSFFVVVWGKSYKFSYLSWNAKSFDRHVISFDHNIVVGIFCLYHSQEKMDGTAVVLAVAVPDNAMVEDQ